MKVLKIHEKCYVTKIEKRKLYYITTKSPGNELTTLSINDFLNKNLNQSSSLLDIYLYKSRRHVIKAARQFARKIK